MLVVQTVEPRAFGADDVRMLTTAGAQLAPIVSEARDARAVRRAGAPAAGALAQNLWWSWDDETTSLFRELDPVLWRELRPQPDRAAAADSDRAARGAGVAAGAAQPHQLRLPPLKEYLRSKHTWGARHAGVLWARPVAYFSAEFGLHESMPIYSGGLGVLAGDHIKSASDLGVPLVGVGLYYDQGYFQQRLDRDGWQQEDYIDVDHRLLPIEPADARRRAGHRRDRDAHRHASSARVWQLAVGRNTLLLLDSNVDGNSPEDRELTARLYGGDERVRIRQELLLGVGGVRALHALGHHAGRRSSERRAQRVRRARARPAADGRRRHRRRRSACAASSPQVVFTTHTPVPAGHDRFSPRAGRRASRPAARRARPRRTTQLHGARAASNPHDHGEDVLHDGAGAEAVAPRQRRVVAARPGVARDVDAALSRAAARSSVPIGHITNGVHVQTWLAPQMHQVYDRHLGPDWPQRSGDAGLWDAIDDVDDGELWETHQTLKARLIDFVRRRAAQQAERRGEPAESSRSCGARSSLDALTIGFARRFATYKRANLILQDIEALAALVNDPQMPVQFVFAGKAHPHDEPGQGSPAADRAADARSAVRRQAASSSRTTTSTSAGTWCRASTCGSTTRGGRSKPPAPAARRSCSTAA